LITEYDFPYCDTSKKIQIEATLTDIGATVGVFPDLVQFADKKSWRVIDETQELVDEKKHERVIVIRFEAMRNEDDGEVHFRWLLPKFERTEFDEERELSRVQHQAIGYFRIRPFVSAGAFTLGEYSALGRHLRKLRYKLGKLPDKLKPIQLVPECRLHQLDCSECTETCRSEIENDGEGVQSPSVGQVLASITTRAQNMLGEDAWADMHSSLGPRYGGLRSSLAAITLGLRPSSMTADEFIPFERLSAGEKYALSFALATAHFPGTESPIIVTEEPEAALYPSAMGQIIGELEGVNSPQVFVTTHSESVVRCFPLENIFVMDAKGTLIPLEKSVDADSDRMGIESLIMPGRTSALFAENVIITEGLEDTIVSRDINRLAIAVLGVDRAFATKKWCFFNAGGAPHAKATAESLRRLGKEVAILFDGDTAGLQAAQTTFADFPTFAYTSRVEKEPTLEVALLHGLSDDNQAKAIRRFRDNPHCKQCPHNASDIKACVDRQKCTSGVEKRERKRRLCACCLIEYREAKEFPHAFETLLTELERASPGRIIQLDVERPRTIREDS
jgi:hypothetical protein